MGDFTSKRQCHYQGRRVGSLVQGKLLDSFGAAGGTTRYQHRGGCLPFRGVVSESKRYGFQSTKFVSNVEVRHSR